MIPAGPRTASGLLSEAWEAAVAYRWAVHAQTGVFRSHLIDIDTWGVLVELAEEDRLTATPAAIMERLVADRIQPQLPPEIVDPAQEIYDAIVHMLDQLGYLIPDPDEADPDDQQETP